MPETNNSYDMQRLQQEAIRRAREMQARAQNAVNSPPPGIRPDPGREAANAAPLSGSVPVRHTTPAEQREPEHNSPPHPAHSSILPGPVGDVFDSLMADSERTLILVLLLILVEEKADSGVILALMYLIL